MKRQMMFLNAATVAVLFLSPLSVQSADFDWAGDLNVRSSTNPTQYVSQLATRFSMADSKVNAMIKLVDKPADAYMVLRLAEMSSRSPDYVIKEYQSKKHKGWGNLAQSLGIKPGSADFKALKNGHDLHEDNGKQEKRDKKDKKDKKHKENGKDKN
ncbi:MAG: hypothetical protein PHR87_07140 [Sulfurospirillaceae bacterium]|nr:hypothetical protein [Sulfurospirillaceae bacterium]